MEGTQVCGALDNKKSPMEHGSMSGICWSMKTGIKSMEKAGGGR